MKNPLKLFWWERLSAKREAEAMEATKYLFKTFNWLQLPLRTQNIKYLYFGTCWISFHGQEWESWNICKEIRWFIRGGNRNTRSVQHKTILTVLGKSSYPSKLCIPLTVGRHIKNVFLLFSLFPFIYIGITVISWTRQKQFFSLLRVFLSFSTLSSLFIHMIYECIFDICVTIISTLYPLFHTNWTTFCRKSSLMCIEK